MLSLVEFGESTRDCSPGHAGKEGPHLAMSGESRGFSGVRTQRYTSTVPTFEDHASREESKQGNPQSQCSRMDHALERGPGAARGRGRAREMTQRGAPHPDC